MTDYMLVPVEPTAEMVEAAQDAYMPFGDMGFTLVTAYAVAPVINIVATKNEQGQIVSVTLQDEDHRILEVIAEADVQGEPDVAGLVEVLETALFGTPLDDVPNRDNDDIWSMCSPHLPERASDALRGHLARIETALAAHRKGGEV